MRQGGWRFWIVAFLFSGLMVHGAASSAPESVPTNATVRGIPRQISPGVYALGQVTIDQERRTVSFPVTVNQRTGLVEYVLVTSTGKTHESVFRTDTAPQDVHVGMLLLGARPASTNFTELEAAASVPGEKVAVELTWRAAGKDVTRPIEEFVLTTNNSRTLSAGPWAYNGSYVDYGTFLAQRDGSIVSIQTDASALINNPRPERTNDDLHHVNTPALPPVDASLQLTIGFYKAAVSTAAPHATNTLEGVITPITPPVSSNLPAQPK